MSEPPKKPEIEFDLPVSLKGEPPETKTQPTGPVSSRAMLDAAALAAAHRPAALRTLEQEQARIDRMRDVMSGAVVQSALSRALEQESPITRAMTGLELPFASRALEEISRQSLMGQIDAFQESSFYEQVMADAECAGALHRAMMGPISDLHTSGALSLLDEARSTGALVSALGAFEKRFIVPDAENLSSLIQQAAGFAPGLDLKKLAESMHHPWLDVAADLRSVTGFAEMQALGLTVRTLSPFTDAAAINVRTALGDWRDVTTFPTTPDLPARSSFYVDRGFRPELTDLPAAAFDESLDLAGLGDDDALETPDPEYADLHAAGDGTSWSAFVRTNKAHMQISLLESWLRHLIDVHLTAAFGKDWAKHKLPNGMYDDWVDKRTKAEKRGAPPRRIIFYADFTDYAPILTKADLWPVFAPFFGTKESVRESFNRLHLPRIEVAHSRALSQDDELYLRVEIMRLGRAIKAQRS